MSVSHATRPSRSCASTASRMVSEIWSAILSGWPSVTDSDENRYSRLAMKAGTLADAEEAGNVERGAALLRAGDDRLQCLQVRPRLGVHRRTLERDEERHRGLQIRVHAGNHV